jgi:hypothetical protein
MEVIGSIPLRNSFGVLDREAEVGVNGNELQEHGEQGFDGDGNVSEFQSFCEKQREKQREQMTLNLMVDSNAKETQKMINTNGNKKVAAALENRERQSSQRTYKEAEECRESTGMWPEWFVQWDRKEETSELAYEMAKEANKREFIVRITTEEEVSFPKMNYENLRNAIELENFYDTLIEFKQLGMKTMQMKVNAPRTVEHLLHNQTSICGVKVKAQLMLTKLMYEVHYDWIHAGNFGRINSERIERDRHYTDFSSIVDKKG